MIMNDVIMLSARMRQRVLDMVNPDVNYTQEDFDKEFSSETLNSLKDPAKELSDYRIPISFVNKSTNPNPEYATNGSSGFDLRADLQQQEIYKDVFVLKAGEVVMVPTGLYFDLPDGYELQIRPRSGLAAKHGVTVLNSPGTVDSDYKLQVSVILINHSKDDYTINHGDRIAQGVIASVLAKRIINLVQTPEIITSSERTGGFGSTGLL